MSALLLSPAPLVTPARFVPRARLRPTTGRVGTDRRPARGAEEFRRVTSCRPRPLPSRFRSSRLAVAPATTTSAPGRASRPARPARLEVRQTIQAAPLRLTRRGRLLVAGLAAAAVTLALVVALGAFGADRATAESGRAPVDERRAVLVQPGDTLWSIAADVDPRSDRRDVIADIVRLNGLSSSQVAAGQTLVLPAG